MRMRVEVEYVRKETITFDVDPDDGFGAVGAPPQVGRVLRALTFHVHHGKDLVKGEKPRLIRWDVIEMVKCDYCGADIESPQRFDSPSVFTKHPESKYNYYCNEIHRALQEKQLDDIKGVYPRDAFGYPDAENLD